MKTIFLALFLVPFLARFFFWSYVFQLKEYRVDRLKEYLETFQGKRALFGKLLILEIPLFFLGLVNIFYINDFVLYSIFFILGLLNIFYLYKIIKNEAFLPKFSFRYILVYLLSLVFLIFISEYFFNYFIFLVLLISPYTLLFISNFVSLPIINLGKIITIKRAKNKTRNNTNTIKIGITGSFGKSSVKEYLAYLLSEYGNTLSTPENVNTELGVANIIIKKLNEKYDYFVAEMGAYRIGEIKALGEIANHKYGFLTAIGTQHIGLFGSQENIKTGKSEIALKVLENSGTLYLNWDNENIRETNSLKNLINIVKYGIEREDLDAKSETLSYNNGFLKFKFKYKNIDEVFETNLLGEHNILNLTGTLAFLVDMGLDLSKIKEKLLSLPKPKHTLNVTTGEYILIDDTYNLSVDSLYAGLNILKYYDGKKILVVDDILELGKDSEKIHFELGEEIGKLKLVDKILFVGKNYKKSFLNGLKYAFFPEENIINDLNNLEKDTVILFEGRGSEKYLNGLLKK